MQIENLHPNRQSIFKLTRICLVDLRMLSRQWQGKTALQFSVSRWQNLSYDNIHNFFMEIEATPISSVCKELKKYEESGRCHVQSLKKSPYLLQPVFTHQPTLTVHLFVFNSNLPKTYPDYGWLPTFWFQWTRYWYHCQD